MILELAILNIKDGSQEQFEIDFAFAGQYISSINGYIEHTFQKSLEQENKYILLVKWEKLEDHTIGFRKSEVYSKWRDLLHHYYDPFPVVEHYENVI